MAAKMEVSELLGMSGVDGPGFRTVEECRQDDGLVHLQFGIQSEAVAISREVVQPAWLALEIRLATSSSILMQRDIVLS
ncbi:hypothetical protein SprV_0100340300 [Sparganum proliferum]